MADRHLSKDEAILATWPAFPAALELIATSKHAAFVAGNANIAVIERPCGDHLLLELYQRDQVLVGFERRLEAPDVWGMPEGQEVADVIRTRDAIRTSPFQVIVASLVPILSFAIGISETDLAELLSLRTRFAARGPFHPQRPRHA